jgi:predicted nucleic acid-binding protein
MIKVLFDTNILIDYLRGYAQAAAEIERTKRINLPDALIWATAQVNDRLLISRNTKDFSADEPGIRAPYQLPT